MYKIDEIISNLQSSLAAAKEATRIGKDAELPREAIASLEETEAKIQATLDAMISLGHQRGAEEPFKVRRKPLDPHSSRKREQNS
jgi:hypothetical protein